MAHESGPLGFSTMPGRLDLTYTLRHGHSLTPTTQHLVGRIGGVPHHVKGLAKGCKPLSFP